MARELQSSKGPLAHLATANLLTLPTSIGGRYAIVRALIKRAVIVLALSGRSTSESECISHQWRPVPLLHRSSLVNYTQQTLQL